MQLLALRAKGFDYTEAKEASTDISYTICGYIDFRPKHNWVDPYDLSSALIDMTNWRYIVYNFYPQTDLSKDLQRFYIVDNHRKF